MPSWNRSLSDEGEWLEFDADDFSSFAVGLGLREFDNIGKSVRRLTSPDGFEVRFRRPRGKPIEFELQLEAISPSTALSISAQADFLPVPVSVIAANDKFLARGSAPATDHDAVVLFFSPRSVESRGAITPDFRFCALRINFGLD